MPSAVGENETLTLQVVLGPSVAGQSVVHWNWAVVTMFNMDIGVVPVFVSTTVMGGEVVPGA